MQKRKIKKEKIVKNSEIIMEEDYENELTLLWLRILSIV